MFTFSPNNIFDWRDRNHSITSETWLQFRLFPDGWLVRYFRPRMQDGEIEPVTLCESADVLTACRVANDMAGYNDPVGHNC